MHIPFVFCEAERRQGANVAISYERSNAFEIKNNIYVFGLQCVTYNL
ncbi:MAG: hypothetical protein JPMHGGIA_01529 [Saprospiraceae bacterium]|jgi:hypothetical protein|nr:hypothetical protein [Saprospiraceae bacterium]